MTASPPSSIATAAVSRWRGWVTALGLVLLTLGVYWQSVGHEFIVLDDPDYVRDNEMVKRGLTTEGVVWAFTSDRAMNWHPVTWLSLMLDAQLHRWFGGALAFVFEKDADGLFPGAYHLTNVLIHALNAVVLLAVLHLLTGAWWRSACVAALFAVHPMHVESVAWISERKDVLSMFFMLLMIRAYVFYVRDRDVTAYLKVVLLFALGLMAKPMLVTLPAVLLLLDFWPLKRVPHELNRTEFLRTFGRLGIEKIPLLIMSMACGFVTMMIQVITHTHAEGVAIPMGIRLGNVLVSYVRYLGKLFWPTDLAILYPNPAYIGQPFWTLPQALAAGSLLAVITTAVLIWGWKRRYLIVGWFWFLGTMVPVIGFVQIGRHAIADRYAYIPYVGLYIMVSWGVAAMTSRWQARGPWLCGMAALLIAACSVLTIRQVAVWKDSETVYLHALSVTKDNWVAHCGLGMVYLVNGGIAARQQNMAEADAWVVRGIAELEKSRDIHSKDSWVRELVADAYDRLGRLAEAQAELETALQFDANRAKTHWSLALILAKRRNHDGALLHARRAVELEPNTAEAHFYLGMVLSEQLKLDEAIASMERAFAMDPELQHRHGEILDQIRTERETPAPK